MSVAYRHKYEMKPRLTNRRWVLLGMGVGTALGLVPVFLPPPLGPLITWVCCGVFGGAVLPLMYLLSVLERGYKRVWWWAIGIGSVVGGIVGFVLGMNGEPLVDWAPAATGTCGLFAGFAVMEILIRRRDARILAEAEDDSTRGYS
jgi:MFS family permease